MRAERLLRNMHKVFSHDLPNEMVAVHSLLQFLALEETERLSDNGREYLRRVQNATRRASDMVRFLKEMARLNQFACRTENVALGPLMRELHAEWRRLHPDSELLIVAAGEAPSLPGDPRVFLQALLEAFGGSLGQGDGRCPIRAGGCVTNDAVAWTFAFDDRAAGLDEKMEIILAREWLALCGATLTWTDAGFVIRVPSR